MSFARGIVTIPVFFYCLVYGNVGFGPSIQFCSWLLVLVPSYMFGFPVNSAAFYGMVDRPDDVKATVVCQVVEHSKLEAFGEFIPLDTDLYTDNCSWTKFFNAKKGRLNFARNLRHLRH